MLTYSIDIVNRLHDVFNDPLLDMIGRTQAVERMAIEHGHAPVLAALVHCHLIATAQLEFSR